MSLKYNPLLSGKLDETKRNLNDLEDVNAPEPIDNGKVLTFQSGTWIPETAAGGGDMYKGTYDINDDGIVDNSERLEGETLGSVQAHTVNAINILGTLTDANIPDVETLSYGFTFADAQIPTLDATKIISGTFDATQIPNLPTTKIATGTFNLARIPAIDDDRIPDLETLSYGAAFGTAQIPSIGAYKVASGTLNADRIPALPTTRITSGTFNADRIPILPIDRYGSAVLVSGTRVMTGDLDFAKHQAKEMALEALGSAPASPATAQMYYNTATDKVMVYVA